MIETKGNFTHEEILSQPRAWEDAFRVLKSQQREINDLIRKPLFEEVIFTGCGSTYYLSLAAAAFFQEVTGKKARGIPASELWLTANAFTPDGKTLLVPVSRSGETTETLHACNQFRKNNGGKILTLSCYPDMPLAQCGDVNVILPSGQEQSIAQTRAFSTLFLSTMLLAYIDAHQPTMIEDMQALPEISKYLLANYEGLAAELGTNNKIDRYYFLGSSTRYGLACELNLKMKEMSLSFSEAFHFMEFRHGPKSMVTESTLITGLVSNTQQGHELAVLEEMKGQGARILTIGEAEMDVSFHSHVSEPLRNLLYLPFGQLMAYHHALSKGLDPDKPKNLDAVVRL
jgi:glucosamine--fructose-6-phosphate aminotransferase (isomerizing)